MLHNVEKDTKEKKVIYESMVLEDASHEWVFESLFGL